MFLIVCWYVELGLMEIQTPAPTLMKFCTHTLTYPRKVLVQVCPLPPLPSRPGGPEPLKAEEHIFENCVRNKRCSAGYKLTQAAPGTPVSRLIEWYGVYLLAILYFGQQTKDKFICI